MKLKQLTVINTCTDDFVYADEKMFEIILRNLLSNAIKFSYSGGRIEISSWHEAGYTGIRFTNFGERISAERIKALLRDSPVQSTSGTKGETGHGIGMKICRQLIELHGGQLTITSDDDHGTAFSVLFPDRNEN